MDIIIIAAGKSSRFGSPKALAKFKDSTVINYNINILKKYGINYDRIILYTTPELADSYKKVLPQDVKIVEATEYDRGSGHAVIQAIKDIEDISTQSIFMWSDVILPDNSNTEKLMDVLHNTYHSVIPVCKSKDNYITIQLDDASRISGYTFGDSGYTEKGIFKLDKYHVHAYGTIINRAIEWLDLAINSEIETVDIPELEVYSFNTKEELNEIETTFNE